MFDSGIPLAMVPIEARPTAHEFALLGRMHWQPAARARHRTKTVHKAGACR